MDDFWDTVCAWMQLWYSLFVMSSVALVLTTFGVFLTEPGTAPYFINLFNFALLVPTAFGTLFVLRRCRAKA